MTTARDWRQTRSADGPHQARHEDISALNLVFSDAFTERYRRDGMSGVRVPFLNPAIWRYAIDDAAGGAMLWRDDRDDVVAFNMVHRSGREGWMGPLAIRPDWQGAGLGKSLVSAGVQWLQREDMSVIGLETMPRTMDNIGFYSSLGFVPGPLTVTLSSEATTGTTPTTLLGRLGASDRADALEEARTLVDSLVPGYDFTREIQLTEEFALGDTVLVHEGSRLVAFALCHSVPLVEGRVREELRVLKLAAASAASFATLCRSLSDFARRSGTRRVALRMQGAYPDAYRHLIATGARVRWTDLRMSLTGYDEPRAPSGVVLSNWEI
jgi:GNAT superfamily N-acetyltransferase